MLNGIKQINKSKIESMGLTENLVKKYSQKETAALYKELDIVGLISECTNQIEDKSLSIKEQVKFEMEFLEYTKYTNEKAGKNFYIITEFMTYNDKQKPYVTLHNVKTGCSNRSKESKFAIINKTISFRS